MEQKDQAFKCTGDCLKCSLLQRQYCAAQFTYNSMRMVEDLSRAVASLQGTVDGLKEKLDAMQGNEASLFIPVRESEPKSSEPVAAPAMESGKVGMVMR